MSWRFRSWGRHWASERALPGRNSADDRSEPEVLCDEVDDAVGHLRIHLCDILAVV